VCARGEMRSIIGLSRTGLSERIQGKTPRRYTHTSYAFVFVFFVFFYLFVCACGEKTKSRLGLR